jgi:predicted DsbA family dithiol-disulfide isomerase
VRVERLEREYDVEVEWLPFELHPEVPPEGMPVEQLLPAAYRERVEAGVALLAREAGLVLRRPARLANSRLALQAAEFARDAGAFEAAHVALFRAHWEEGRDLGAISTLLDVLGAAGLRVDGLREALERGSYAARIDRARKRADALGIDAIPAHVAGPYVVLGAQPYPVFEELMQRLGAGRRGGLPH